MLNNAEKGAEFLEQMAQNEIDSNNKDKSEVQEWNGNLAGKIDYLIPFDCLAKKIQYWILRTSIYPQPAIAYAAALSVISVAIGRDIAIDNIKGNLMFLCMAESGEGKDWPFKAAKLILDSIDMGNCVHQKMASGAAIIEALQESPSMLLHIDEMGNYLASINGKGANQYSKEIVGIMTECYTSADSSYRGKKTKGHDPIEIIEPNMSILGLSTEGQVFDGLETSKVADGSLARYAMYFGQKQLMPQRLAPNGRNIPDEITCGLNKLVRDHRQEPFFCSKQLKLEKAYDDAKWTLVCEMKKKGNAIAKRGGEKSYFVPFYNRIAVRSIQIALNLDQCQSIDILNWVADIELKSVELFIKKFRHMGADNEHERLTKLLQAKIKESGVDGITAKKLLQSTRQIRPQDRKMMLEEMIETRTISKLDLNVEGARVKSKVYFWNK